MDECNVGLLNLVLSHARHAVKVRRNYAHYENKLLGVWDIMERSLKRDIGMLFVYMKRADCVSMLVDGCSLIEVREGILVYNFAM